MELIAVGFRFGEYLVLHNLEVYCRVPLLGNLGF